MVLSDPRAKAFDNYRLKIIAWRDISRERFSEFLFQFANRRPDMFFGNIVKGVHDELNRSTARSQQGGQAGVPIDVENRRGDHWPLVGDTTLSASDKTLEIINQAIAQSEANLELAVTLPTPSGPLVLDDFSSRIPELLENVWSYTPHPTAATQKHMDRVSAESTDMASPIAARRFAEVILNHLTEVIEGLHDEGVLETKAALHKEAQEMMSGAGMY